MSAQPVHEQQPVLPSAGYGEVEEDSASWPPAPMPDLEGVEVDRQIRCGKCGKLLIEFAARPWQTRCPRCKTVNGSGPATR